MHPLYKKTKHKTLFIGSFAILVGIFGAVIPILPGTLFVFLGISVLSLQSKLALRSLVVLRTRYPKIASTVKHVETQLVHFFNLTTHKREHISIPRGDGSMLSVLAEPTEFIAGTAILLHSLSGTAETEVMGTLAEALKIRGFGVVRFDARNSLGDIEGEYTKFTTTSYREDLEHVIAWASTQPWWQEPLVLVGHSLGGMVASLYASEHQAEVDGLILLAPTLSGESYEQTFLHHYKEKYVKWKETGTREVLHPISHEPFALPFRFVDDMKRYDVTTQVKNLTMPMFVFTGTEDTVSMSTDLETFCKKIGHHAVLKKIEHVGHTPESRQELQSLAKTLSELPCTLHGR